MQPLFKCAKAFFKAGFTGTPLLAVLLGSGCATYKYVPPTDPAAPPPATLVRNFPAIGDFILYKIDDLNRPAGFKKHFLLTPGPHTVTVGVNEGLLTGNRFKIPFEAKSGDTYEVNAKVTSEKFLSGTWHTWVTEVSTGKTFEGDVVKK